MSDHSREEDRLLLADIRKRQPMWRLIVKYVAVGVGALFSLIFLFDVIAAIISSPKSVDVRPVVQALAAPIVVPDVVDQAAAREAAKVRFQHDRDALRKTRPKTEADAVAILGRQPASITDTGKMVMLMWFYDTKADGRDVLQVVTENGKVTLLNL